MAGLQLLLCFCIAVQGVGSFQWSSGSPPDGQVLKACQSSNVEILWDYLLDAGDSVDDVSWYYDGQSQDVDNRVQVSGNAGLSLTGVQVGDSGKYTMTVHVLHGQVQQTFRRHIVLVVTGQLMPVGGYVHVTQSSEVILDPRTGQYSVQLQCGQWVSANNPPFQVEWVTPEGQVVNSSNFHDHHFTLILPPPIKGGNYTCRIPPQHADLACLHGNAGHQGEATIMVDKVDALFSILRNENQQLKEQLNVELSRTKSDLTQTKSELSQTKSDLTQTKSDLTQTKSDLTQTQTKLSHALSGLTQTKSDLTQTKLSDALSDLTQTKSDLTQTKLSDALSDLNQIKSDLTQTKSDLTQIKSDLTQTRTQLSTVNGQVNTLVDAARHQVAFQATGLKANHPPKGTPLIFSNVSLNQGQAYNSTSGYFVSPYQGLYYFSATTGGWERDLGAWFFLYVDSTRICGSYNNFEAGHDDFSTLHAALHLNVGQRVWIFSDGSHYNDKNFTFFSGFLLSHDFI